jgi:WD40 repeat protein
MQLVRKIPLNNASQVVAISADGRTALTADGYDNYVGYGEHRSEVCVWDLETGTLQHTLRHDSTVFAVAISADGQVAIAGDDRGTIKSWNLVNGAEQFSAYEPDFYDRHRDDRFKMYAIEDISFTPDEKQIISVQDGYSLNRRDKDGGNFIHIWDANSGKLLRSMALNWPMQSREYGDYFSLHQAQSVTLTTDGKAVTIDPRFGEIAVWSLAQNEHLRTIQTQQEIFCMCVTADGQRIVAYSADPQTLNAANPGRPDTLYSLQVWNLESGELERTMTGHKSVVKDVAATPNGVISVSRDLKMWELKHVLAPAVDEQRRSVVDEATLVMVEGRLVALNNGGHNVDDPDLRQVPQDWVYDVRLDYWFRCGHGLDIDSTGVAAYRGGSSKRMWAIGGRQGGHPKDTAAGHTLGLAGRHFYSPRD